MILLSIGKARVVAMQRKVNVCVCMCNNRERERERERERDRERETEIDKAYIILTKQNTSNIN